MSSFLKPFRRAADCTSMTLWETTATDPAKAKSAAPAEIAPVAVADVTRRLAASGSGKTQPIESFVFTLQPTVRLSLLAGDVVESLVGAGQLEFAKKASATKVLPERCPTTVSVAGDGQWSFRKLDQGPTLLRITSHVPSTSSGPRPKCLQPPHRCDPP